RFQPWKRGEPFDPAALEADMLRLRKFYFDRGFLSATASVESVTQDPASLRRTPSSSRSTRDRSRK
ncbi:MAG: hypothetical protein LJE91_01230, partial [Gammaproteobacteria bacterium]|nr:hypothetical protein [Gammaproteobacteria bacterium]